MFFVGISFFLAALNIYYGIKGTDKTALNLAVAVFMLGYGLIEIISTL